MDELDQHELERDGRGPIAVATDRDPALASRYGRTPRSRRTNRWIIGGVAAFFVVVFAAWLVWGGLGGAASSLEATDTAHTVLDDRTVSVSFTLSVPPGTPVDCAVQALNENFAVVGWKVFSVPASDRHLRALTETVATTERANTGLIYRCWLS